MNKRSAMRVLGLYRLREREWDKLIYLHRNAGGETCVNGSPARIVLHKAGADPMPESADYVIVLPERTEMSDAFLAVNGGECLLWKSGGDLEVRSAGFLGVSAPVEFWRPMRAGVLTVSDKGSRGERKDTAGQALADMIEALGSIVVVRDILPDDRGTIAARLAGWADNEGLQIVLTTGGTGLSPRDVTPEALMDVQDRVVPGFGEVMRSRSMLHTPRGFLTRSVAVLRGGTLIIALPGSERAVRQCFEAIAPALRHGVEILSGWDAECGQDGHRHDHAALGAEGTTSQNEGPEL